MRKQIFSQKIIQIFFLFFILTFTAAAFLPMSVFAQATTPGVNKAPPLTHDERCKQFTNQFTVGSGKDSTNIINGAPFFCTATDLLIPLITYLLAISGTVTILFLIVGGFWYLTSAGNEEQIEKGKKTLMNAVIGLVVITLSFAIVKIVTSTLLGITPK